MPRCKKYIFSICLLALILVNTQFAKSHTEVDGPFLDCHGSSSGGVTYGENVEEHNVDINICYDEEDWEELERNFSRNSKINLSYHTTLRNEAEEIILPESEIIDPANIDWTTRDMGFKEIEDIERENASNFGDVDHEEEDCETAENETWAEEGNGDEEEHDQIEMEDLPLVDIFVNYNDSVSESDKSEASDELEEWVETIRRVVDEENGSIEVETDAKFLHNAKNGRSNGNNDNEHNKVFQSCKVIFGD